MLICARWDLGLWTLVQELIGRPPVKHLQLNGRRAVELVELRCEGEIESAKRQRSIAHIPQDGLQSLSAVGDPELGVFLLRAHPLKRPGMGDVAEEQSHWRIA